ncbi:MAG: hypothetical protein ACREQN_05605 [Candidatus Binataceae bacterium]
MAMAHDIATIDNELDAARRDLHQTMAQFGHKVERTEAWLNPQELVKRHPWTSSCVAAAAGFVAGGGVNVSALEALALGALLTLRLWVRPANDHAPGDEHHEQPA